MVHKEHVYGIIHKSAVERNYLQVEYTIINFKHMQAYSSKVSRKTPKQGNILQSIFAHMYSYRILVGRK